MTAINFKDYWAANKKTIVKNWNTQLWFREQDKYNQDARKYIKGVIAHMDWLRHEYPAAIMFSDNELEIAEHALNQVLV